MRAPPGSGATWDFRMPPASDGRTWDLRGEIMLTADSRWGTRCLREGCSEGSSSPSGAMREGSREESAPARRAARSAMGSLGSLASLRPALSEKLAPPTAPARRASRSAMGSRRTLERSGGGG